MDVYAMDLESYQIHSKKPIFSNRGIETYFGVLTKFRTSNVENSLNNDFFNHASFNFSKFVSSPS